MCWDITAVLSSSVHPINSCLAATAGIWGGKGQGKTFQCTLAYKKLDIAPIVMSAGELESGNAGEPAKLIRQRYREVRSPGAPHISVPSVCMLRARWAQLMGLITDLTITVLYRALRIPCILAASLLHSTWTLSLDMDAAPHPHLCCACP